MSSLIISPGWRGGSPFFLTIASSLAGPDLLVLAVFAQLQPHVKEPQRDRRCLFAGLCFTPFALPHFSRVRKRGVSSAGRQEQSSEESGRSRTPFRDDSERCSGVRKNGL